MKSWEYKLQNFKRALSTLQELKERDINTLSKLEIAGAIKQFEYTQELGWKTIHAFLTEMGVPDLLLASRSTIDAAFEAGLIEDYKVYHDMIEKRNLSAHIYNEDVALAILSQIVPNYLPALEAIAQTLEDEIA